MDAAGRPGLARPELTGGDPLWLGVVATAQFLPVMVLGLFAGVLADVLPKRQTLMAVQAVMMVAGGRSSPSSP